MPRLLTSREVEKRLEGLEGWETAGRFISKTFEFKTFLKGIDFVDVIARVAESQEHHPDIHIRYTKVKLSIQTHSEGGVTEWDFALAKAIEKTISTPRRGH